jgi:hypothetical protein
MGTPGMGGDAIDFAVMDWIDPVVGVVGQDAIG